MRPGARRELLAFYLAGLVVAYALKSFYSHAQADDLNWILAPTSWLAGVMSGIPFERENHVGWVTHSHRLIVGPGCAGLNFMIVGFVALFFARVHRFSTVPAKAGWLGLSIAVSCFSTIITNALRIIMAIQLYAMDIYGETITPQRVHLAAGTVLYGTSLMLVYEMVCRGADRFVPPSSGRRGMSMFIPVFWYLAIVLGVPVVTRAYEQDMARFLEHALLVIIALLMAGLGWFLFKVLLKLPRLSIGTRLHGRPRMRC